jgi:hypothetical protein
MGYVPDAVVGVAPNPDAPKDDLAVYQTKVEDASFVLSGMLFAMESDLQKRFENMSAFEMIIDLKDVFAPQARWRGTKFPSCSSLPVWTNTVV